MPIASSEFTRRVQGYPAQLAEWRELCAQIEPDLVLGLHALVRAAGCKLSYCETAVLSGSAGQFLYSREHPECADLAFVPPTETLLRTLNATWRELVPSGSATAFEVLDEWIGKGRLVLARLREPLLVFGSERRGLEHFVLAARLRGRLTEERISILECDRRYWRYPVDEGNVLLCVEAVDKQVTQWRELLPLAVRRIVRAWHTIELAGCASGDAAYRALRTDLAEADVDFTTGKAREWTGGALWRQWTARTCLKDFCERAAPRFGGADRRAFEKAAFYYERCVAAWRSWATHLGPTWNVVQTGFSNELPEDFLALWRDHKRRQRAAQCVEDARGWEEKAVYELTKVMR